MNSGKTVFAQLMSVIPEYEFDKHKGYGTSKHYEKLLEHGPCEIHRISYKPIKGMI